MTPLERRVFRAVDGKLSLAELYNEVRGSYYRFLQATYRLAVVEALDIESVGDHSDSGSAELRLADLLIEQVTEEQAVFLRHHLAVPFDALERYVPVWLFPLSSEAAGRLGEAMLEFYRRIDGTVELGALLSGLEPAERSRRMDWLVLQLRNRTLALLPRSVGELEFVRASADSADERDLWGRRLRPREA